MTEAMDCGRAQPHPGHDWIYARANVRCPGERVDNVNSPEHYRWLPVEAIDITENFNYCMGNALKYIIRADHKGKPVEDLEKARWYLDREIQRRANS